MTPRSVLEANPNREHFMNTLLYRSLPVRSVFVSGCLIFFVAGCAEVRSPTDVTPVASTSIQAVVSMGLPAPQDVAEMKIEYPNGLKPRISDSALIAGFGAVGGRGFIGLKSASSARASETIRSEMVAFSPNPLFQGTRAAISASDVADGILAIQKAGAKVRRFQAHLGGSSVRVVL